MGNIMRSNMRRGSYKQWHLHGGSRRKPALNDLMPHLASLEIPAKARFVVRLVTGASLRSCANALGISYETARRHLQSVFRKTGAHRQVELILAVVPAMSEMRRQKAHRREYYFKRRAALTPEQLAAERAYQREYERKRRAAMTPEERQANNVYKHEHQRKRWAMPPEELDARRAREREYHRKWRATRTPEQLEALRTYQREYHRKWRATRKRRRRRE
jgi:DNA-binding CsgD family transcriptional regulator